MILFRERLKELREEFNLDQKEMGKLLNLSASAYGYYEQGRNEPSLETLLKIAHQFNVSTDYLLGLSNSRQAPTFYYLPNDNEPLTASEVKTIQKMKRLSLLNELSEHPEENVARLQRYWQFIQQEHHRK